MLTVKYRTRSGNWRIVEAAEVLVDETSGPDPIVAVVRGDGSVEETTITESAEAADCPTQARVAFIENAHGKTSQVVRAR